MQISRKKRMETFYIAGIVHEDAVFGGEVEKSGQSEASRFTSSRDRPVRSAIIL
jgi:hypothetical protein